jgi:hypothetical protein
MSASTYLTRDANVPLMTVYFLRQQSHKGTLTRELEYVPLNQTASVIWHWVREKPCYAWRKRSINTIILRGIISTKKSLARAMAYVHI